MHNLRKIIYLNRSPSPTTTTTITTDNTYLQITRCVGLTAVIVRTADTFKSPRPSTPRTGSGPVFRHFRAAKKIASMSVVNSWNLHYKLLLLLLLQLAYVTCSTTLFVQFCAFCRPLIEFQRTKNCFTSARYCCCCVVSHFFLAADAQLDKPHAKLNQQLVVADVASSIFAREDFIKAKTGGATLWL